jgi:conjugal transfer pilus assembly protein TraW
MGLPRKRLLLTSLLCSVIDQANGIVGQTFPIAEPDTLTEIQERAAKINWDALKKQALARTSAFTSVHLPLAQQEAERLFDPTYTLPRDITDAQGKVLFAQGAKVNVYRRIKDPARTIVIADLPSNYQWLQTVAKPTERDRILLANGNVMEARERTHLKLFLLEARIVERFGLQRVPSIVQQEGTMLKVHEYVAR